MDEHVSRAVTVGLRRRGLDVLTVQEDGRTGASDEVILDRAFELSRVLFSQDDDLLVEANRRQKTSLPFCGVSQPIGVAEYQLVESLPEELQTSLPSIEEIRLTRRAPLVVQLEGAAHMQHRQHV